MLACGRRLPGVVAVDRGRMGTVLRRGAYPCLPDAGVAVGVGPGDAGGWRAGVSQGIPRRQQRGHREFSGGACAVFRRRPGGALGIDSGIFTAPANSHQRGFSRCIGQRADSGFGAGAGAGDDDRDRPRRRVAVGYRGARALAGGGTRHPGRPRDAAARSDPGPVPLYVAPQPDPGRPRAGIGGRRRSLPRHARPAARSGVQRHRARARVDLHRTGCQQQFCTAA